MESYAGIQIDAGDTVIAVDGGARHARALGVVPGVLIGDMDSVDNSLLAELKGLGCRLCTYPREKDQVDTELALDYAMSLQPEEIVIYGATGGRLDHMLAGLQLLAKPTARGIRTSIRDCRHSITLAAPHLPVVIEGRGRLFSLLPLTTSVTGVTTTGARWELSGAEFVMGKPYGVSNLAEASRVTVAVSGGMLLVIEVFSEEAG
jgi:thiamine pyrophosphokinase